MQSISLGQNSFAVDTMGQNYVVPSFVPGTKITPLVLSRGQKSHLFLVALHPRSVPMMRSPSVTAAASAGDNDDDNNDANKPLLQAGIDADGGGCQQPNNHLASAWQESVSSDANAHGGRRTSSSNVTNEGGRAAGNALGRVDRQKSAKKRQQ